MSNRLDVFWAADVYNSGVDLSSYQYQFLAQGDSWFSTNTLKANSTNMLKNMFFSKRAAAVNCAYPGRTLARMAGLPATSLLTRDPRFQGYLSGAREQWWSALLLSGGGNDLINALQLHPGEIDKELPADCRLLLTEEEWDPGAGVQRYIREEGWSVFAAYLVQQYNAINQLRATSKYNKDTPIVTHVYDLAMPRDVGAGPTLGPWLYKALTDYEIPTADWKELTIEFMQRLAGVICALDFNPPAGTRIAPPFDIAPIENFHVVWTQGTLAPAEVNAPGATADWENEIHPTQEGYVRLGKKVVAITEPLCDARLPLSLMKSMTLERFRTRREIRKDYDVPRP
ncbi:hypothetical protein [Cupriavidus pauculus]|uniref:hypothetical protein n=1 Tax=Cupriavidus pauculus TaxID=82633 RepID=UPI0015DEB35D|nr:hypothetical protein [Cupriavidus pauculus]